MKYNHPMKVFANLGDTHIRTYKDSNMASDQVGSPNPSGVGNLKGTSYPHRMVNWWFGILGVPLSNNHFHKVIPRIQTTNPKNKLIIS